MIEGYNVVRGDNNWGVVGKYVEHTSMNSKHIKLLNTIIWLLTITTENYAFIVIEEHSKFIIYFLIYKRIWV